MRLINADKIHPDVRTQHGALAISQGQLAYAETVNAILIPEGATNGDILKALFPEATEYGDSTRKGLMFANEDKMCIFNLTTDKGWWDAEYKGVK